MARVWTVLVFLAGGSWDAFYGPQPIRQNVKRVEAGDSSLDKATFHRSQGREKEQLKTISEEKPSYTSAYPGWVLILGAGKGKGL